MKGSGVYQILNKANGKRYIGSTVNFQKRKTDHFQRLKRGMHHNDYLQNAWNLYGAKSFAFEVLEYVSNLDQLIEREQHYIDCLCPEYNLSPTAGSQLGIKRTEETKQKMRQANIGKKLSEETKQKIKKAGHRRFEDLNERKKIGMFHRGRNVSEATRQKMREWALTRFNNPEERKKITEARWGKNLLFETQEKTTSSLPKKLSLETRQKMSKARRGEKNPATKFTESEVIEIKRLLEENRLAQRAIAEKYDVSISAINRIKTGKTWFHIH